VVIPRSCAATEPRGRGISGRIDQGAGILFNLKPNGDYLTIRANPPENNLVLCLRPDAASVEINM
jgi:hypothetical protein